MDAFAHMGHYARPLPPETAPLSLPLLGALAAFEALARLDWSLSIAVFAEDPTAPQRWPAGASERLRARPTLEALTQLDAARAPTLSTRDDDVDGLAVMLTPDAHTHAAAVTIHCALGADALAVTVHSHDHRRAHALEALAELFAEILHDLLTGDAPSAFAARGIGPASLARVLGPLAGARVDHGPFIPIPRAIERHVDLHPERIAMRCEGHTLTYGTLETLANGLAFELARDGVGHGQHVRGQPLRGLHVCVPVLIDHGLELPVAYLALMKLGAAFIPLDPAWPPARLGETLARLGDAPILCHAAAAVPHPFRPRARPFSVESVPQHSERQAAPLGPEDVIYGLFTSGTTGRPRCALNLHGGLANRFAFMSRTFAHAAHGPVLQTSRPTFDSSVWQLLWPLTVGGEVILPGRGDVLDLAATVALIGRHQVAMTDFVPSVLVQLVALAERDPQARDRLRSLRALVVGGEAIAARAVHRLRELLPDVRVSNAYGPTETSIGMVFHPVEPDDGDAIPIGRPIDNCTVVVVDPELRPLPPGARGELLLGGACVGGGYLGDPEQTARAFVPNPFGSAIPGERLYRSGDLGYVDAAGRLRFAGRRDDQVKLAGIRLELGEVEAVAVRHPAVQRARALIATRHGRPSLALCVAADGLTREDLGQHLAASLPRHAVPRHLLVLPSLPLTAHGKVDVGALRALLDTALDARTPGRDAATLLAQVLARVAQAPGGPELRVIAPDDRLFDAGLDSLGALALALELAQHFGVPFDPEELVGNPSARQLAERIEGLRAVGGAAVAEPELALLDRDARIVASLSRAPSAPPGPPRAVLLTGATGFVGSYLARDLLSHPDLELYALCRTEAADIASSLRRKGLWREDFAPRLHVLHGDLAAPRLGLDAAIYAHLAEHCDAIVHAGARVNLLFDYRAHRATNVLGTAALVELAGLGRPKAFHHLSTLGIYEREAARAAPIPEAVDCEGIAPPTSGYSRSKWVAERLLADAGRRGIPVTLHRLGEVMPAADGGEPNFRALTHLFLSACVDLAAMPDVAMISDWSPVDWVAAAIVGVVLRPAAHGRAYHHVHPARVRFDEALDRAGCLGQPLQRLPATAWRERLAERLRADPSPTLSLLAALLPVDTTDDTATPDALAGLLTDNPRLFARREAAALESILGLTVPAVDAAIASYTRLLAALARPDATP